MVSVDQYIWALPGQLRHTKGREMKKDKYYGGKIFVDHASLKVFIKHQVTLNAEETAMGKRAFERDAMSARVRVTGYHADNIPFTADEWKNYMMSNDQELSLSGMGAHHQNGIAKRTTKTVLSWA
jgi:hypothetical protein